MRSLLCALTVAVLALGAWGPTGGQASLYNRVTMKSWPAEPIQADQQDDDVDPGAPLFLTPLIESGNVTGAQQAALVKPLAGNVKSFSGFFTVNKALDSNMFFWYFPAENDEKGDASVVLWLQGGPGASSMYGLFAENGPYSCEAGKVKLRKYSWSKQYNVLYIDNPVGAGYSFTGHDQGYARNQTQVGRDLYEALVQFYKMFPHLKGRQFFITGESYAGKYIPTLGYTIHRNSADAIKNGINLQGLFIGNGWVDPGNMMHYSDLTFQLGLTDAAGRAALKAYEDRIVALVQQRRWMDAFLENDLMLGGDLTPYPTLFKNLTGFGFYFNFLYTADPDHGDGIRIIQTPAVRRALHVGNSTWDRSTIVEKHLREDMLQSTAPWLSELLDHYRVMLYNGQLDIIVAYALTDSYLAKLQWSGAEEFARAPRRMWRTKGELAGYTKQAGRLTQVLVRDAGHMVPQDQPRWALDLLNRFTANKPF